MSPRAGLLLVQEIVPIIQAVVPRSVKPAASEDAEELVADAVASAAAAVDSLERRGKKLIPGSIAYYAVQRAKAGRRSVYSGEADALCASAEIRGRVSRLSLDQEVVGTPEDDSGCLHDLLAATGEDTALVAARELDWDVLVKTLSTRERAVLRATAEGRPLKAVARKFKVSSPRITQIAREIGKRIRQEWGPNTIALATMEPNWKRGTLRAGQERAACRFERARAAA